MRDGIKCFTYCGDDHCVCDARNIFGGLLVSQAIPQEDEETSLFTKQDINKIIQELETLRLSFTDMSSESLILDQATVLLKYYQTTDLMTKLSLYKQWEDLNRVPQIHHNPGPSVQDEVVNTDEGTGRICRVHLPDNITELSFDYTNQLDVDASQAPLSSLSEILPVDPIPLRTKIIKTLKRWFW